ncbi:hypothetical protein CYY_008639 [Polysphondylium violaceum]|uniref:WD40 repeat-containing protein n=1 Tax=Polysphondylium violaceum TaxID=133409 RepID=A0A8J4PMU3_9MYCE|nr:hypothetical protein CYY_008639 [Polysphondylium violaceum]
MFENKTNKNQQQIDNINNGLSDININVQKSIQQSEIIVVDSLFSICGNYLVACNNIGFINVWKLEESLHPPKKETSSSRYNDQDDDDDDDDLVFNMVADDRSKSSSSSSSSSNIFSHKTYKPHITFHAQDTYSPINKLHFFNDQVLLSSGDVDIKIWNWTLIKEILENFIAKYNEQQQQQPQSSIFPIPPSKTHKIVDVKQISLSIIDSPQIQGIRGHLSEKAEINGIDSFGSTLFFASGNNNAYSWDLNQMQNISVFKGHTDYLHEIKYNSAYHNLITTSEDSTVRIWDSKTAKCTNILNPFYKISFDCNGSNGDDNNNNTNTITPASTLKPPSASKQSSSNNNFNEWCGPMDLDETGSWLVVGGSCTSLWYLGRLNTMVSQLTNTESTYSVLFNKEKIITAGSEGAINYYGLDGRILMKVNSTSKILYTLAYNPHPRNQILVAGGASPFINTFINQENIAFSYCFTNNE